jgi:hypothetical protein
MRLLKTTALASAVLAGVMAISMSHENAQGIAGYY